MPPLKLATYNIDRVRARLPVLLQWLAAEAPDIVCLQQLKASDRGFPVRRHPGRWRRRPVARPALIERPRHPRPGHGPSGDPATPKSSPRHPEPAARTREPS